MIIIITDLYSAFRSEDTEALDAAQENWVSLNRWVFKWRLKVRMFSHSRISAGREFEVDGAATSGKIYTVNVPPAAYPLFRHWFSWHFRDQKLRTDSATVVNSRQQKIVETRCQMTAVVSNSTHSKSLVLYYGQFFFTITVNTLFKWL